MKHLISLCLVCVSTHFLYSQEVTVIFMEQVLFARPFDEDVEGTTAQHHSAASRTIGFELSKELRLNSKGFLHLGLGVQRHAASYTRSLFYEEAELRGTATEFMWYLPVSMGIVIRPGKFGVSLLGDVLAPLYGEQSTVYGATSPLVVPYSNQSRKLEKIALSIRLMTSYDLSNNIRLKAGWNYRFDSELLMLSPPRFTNLGHVLIGFSWDLAGIFNRDEK